MGISLRVVAGELGGRKLRSPGPRGSSATRPTTDRARTGLFDVLGDVRDLRVLDLFAGSGALGIEALSRGARQAVFVEQDRDALRALRHNVDALGLAERSRVIKADVRSALRGFEAGARFDLVLCDPPWSEGWNQRVLAGGRLAPLLDPDGLLVQERSVRDAPAEPPEGLRLRESRVYGETAFDLYESTGEPSP